MSIGPFVILSGPCLHSVWKVRNVFCNVRPDHVDCRLANTSATTILLVSRSLSELRMCSWRRPSPDTLLMKPASARRSFFLNQFNAPLSGVSSSGVHLRSGKGASSSVVLIDAIEVTSQAIVPELGYHYFLSGGNDGMLEVTLGEGGLLLNDVTFEVTLGRGSLLLGDVLREEPLGLRGLRAFFWGSRISAVRPQNQRAYGCSQTTRSLRKSFVRCLVLAGVFLSVFCQRMLVFCALLFQCFLKICFVICVVWCLFAE